MARPFHAGASDVTPLSRRGFLIGAVGASFAFGFAKPGLAATNPMAPVQGAFEPTIWYSMDRDGIVTVNIIRAEMGQHIGTALARILADELEVDWSNVRLDLVDSNAKWGLMVTGGSWSVWMTFPVFSRAGAAGRIALVEEGARLLGVPVTQCIARSGAVVAGERSISYAEIVRRGNLSRTFTADELAQMPVKPASERRLIGRAVPALDHSLQDNWRRALRHRREGRGYGLCPTKDPADAQRLQGALDRRFRGARREGLYQQHGPRRSVRHSARLGHGLRRHLSGRHSRRRSRQG
jgi:isoquinoline 1-oxidoreductase subunit beta